MIVNLKPRPPPCPGKLKNGLGVIQKPHYFPKALQYKDLRKGGDAEIAISPYTVTTYIKI